MNKEIQKQQGPQDMAVQPPVERRELVQAPVDIYESPEEFLLIADVPGVNEANLKIRLERSELTFEARTAKEEGRVLHCDQRMVSGYSRRFSLPGGIDGGKVSARVKDGVLYIHLPKSEQLKPREIPVRAS